MASSSEFQAEDDAIRLTIKDVAHNRSFRVLVFPSNTVRELKEVIATKPMKGSTQGAPVEAQLLIFAGRKLSNDSLSIAEVTASRLVEVRAGGLWHRFHCELSCTRSHVSVCVGGCAERRRPV